MNGERLIRPWFVGVPFEPEVFTLADHEWFERVWRMGGGRTDRVLVREEVDTEWVSMEWIR